MNRTLKIYLFLLLLLIGLFIFLDSIRPKPIDWSPTFNLTDKIPYGLYVLDKEFETLEPKKTIEKVDKTYYEYLNTKKNTVSIPGNGTLLHINSEYDIDQQSTTELFHFVAKGNSCFLSVENLPKIFTDSLKVELKAQLVINKGIPCWVSNTSLGTQKYNLKQGGNMYYFSKIDTLHTTVLGYQEEDKKQHSNFIKVAYKKGFFYIHLQPVAFTNYHLLKDNHYEYAQKVLSYIPTGTIYWLIKDQNGLLVSDSPFRYILSQPALRMAWYLFLIGMIVFIIFNAKRKQRIVPIIKPLENTTVDFTKTIGNLYYQEGDFQNIIDKKIIYFLERIRNEYLIETTVLNEEFINKLHLKTGREIMDIERVVYLINYHRKSYNKSIESDLIEINKAIEKIIN